MKDCSLSVTPIVKGDMFNLNQHPKNKFDRKQMKKFPMLQLLEVSYMLKYAQSLTLLLQLEC